MKKYLLAGLVVIALVSSSMKAQAQINHIESLTILPDTPTTSDLIKVRCSASFTGSNCYLDSSVISLAADTIWVLAYHMGGSLGTPCRSIDTITIGRLAAANYTLVYKLYEYIDEIDTDTARFVVLQATSTPEELEYQHQVSIYPNPTSSNFTLKTSSESLQKVIIRSILGREVYSTTFTGEINIEPAAFARGMYLVYTTDLSNQRQSVRKLLLE